MLLNSHGHAHTTTPVHDNGSFFDDTVGTNHDGACNGKNSGFGMYNSPCPIPAMNAGSLEYFQQQYLS